MLWGGGGNPGRLGNDRHSVYSDIVSASWEKKLAGGGGRNGTSDGFRFPANNDFSDYTADFLIQWETRHRKTSIFLLLVLSGSFGCAGCSDPMDGLRIKEGWPDMKKRRGACSAFLSQNGPVCAILKSIKIRRERCR